MTVFRVATLDSRIDEDSSPLRVSFFLLVHLSFSLFLSRLEVSRAPRRSLSRSERIPTADSDDSVGFLVEAKNHLTEDLIVPRAHRRNAAAEVASSGADSRCPRDKDPISTSRSWIGHATLSSPSHARIPFIRYLR